MNKFKISPALKNKIRKILLSRDVPFKIEHEGASIFIEVPLSGTKFHKIVQRARCEQLSEETGFFHITKEESEDDIRVAILLHQYNKSSFIVKS